MLKNKNLDSWSPLAVEQPRSDAAMPPGAVVNYATFYIYFPCKLIMLPNGLLLKQIDIWADMR